FYRAYAIRPYDQHHNINDIAVGWNKAFRALARKRLRHRQGSYTGNATTRYAWVVLFWPTKA
ncbi:MAG: hypothetical protein WCP66_07570, partial [Methylococcales bacterium]